MPNPLLVKPDSEFLHSLLEEGGEDLKKCYQCATCSVVCDLSNEQDPFPRKEMIWAQWGLKDRLMADPDIWLCYQCNDCTQRCPRGARPGDVLAAIRHRTVVHYAVPRVLAEWTNQVRSLPLLTLVPVVLLALSLLARPLGPMLGLEHEGPEELYAGLFPHWLLIAFFTTLTTLSFAGALVGVFRFWRAAEAADKAAGRGAPVLGIVPSVVKTLKAILVHERFGKCQTQASRKVTHILAFYGFVILFVVTIYAVIDLYLFPLIGVGTSYPFGILHPMKILANVGCIMLIAGCVRAIIERTRGGKEASASSLFDWVFVSLLLGVGASGLLTQVARFAVEPAEAAQAAATDPETEAAGEEADQHEEAALTAGAYVAFAIYFVHLVFVFELLVYLPYSKFAHILYRTAAMVYAEHTGRTVAATKVA